MVAPPAYLKLRRKAGGFPTVATAVHLELDGERIGGAGIGLAEVAASILR